MKRLKARAVTEFPKKEKKICCNQAEADRI